MEEITEKNATRLTEGGSVNVFNDIAIRLSALEMAEKRRSFFDRCCLVVFAVMFIAITYFFSTDVWRSF